jgi:uncharacterized protein GlcG (DUF336 family)
MSRRMSLITLAQAERIIDAIIERGLALDLRPISVIVVEPGCKVKAFKKEDGASMIRFEMAFGKAYAALALGRSSKLVHQRAEERPIFMRYLIAASGEQIFPEGGGRLIRDDDGEVIGAVGVTGDTEDCDEELAIFGIHAAGLKTDEDCAAMGRRIGLLKTNPGTRRPSPLTGHPIAQSAMGCPVSGDADKPFPGGAGLPLARQ